MNKVAKTMFARLLTVACIALMLAFACTPPEQTPSEQTSSIERDRVDDMMGRFVTQLEEEGLYQPQSVSQDQHLRNELAKWYRAHTGKSAEDKRVLLQLQLERISELAPEIHEILHSSGFEQMKPLEKYRTLIPLLREQRWGMDDSSYIVDTLNRIEQLVTTTSDESVIGHVDRIVGLGVDKMIWYFVSDLNQIALLEENIQKVEEFADTHPEIRAAFFTCTNGASTDRAECYSQCENEYFENEIVGVIEVLENPDEHVMAIAKWQGHHLVSESIKFHEKLTKCLTSHWDAVVPCHEALAEASEQVTHPFAD